MKFSIIVPVYNVKDYLNRCIDSILNQDFIDYEVILIDDGSDDGSERICDDYSSKNPSIRTIHTKNNGLSCARNLGLVNAKGDFIVFLDSDDWINPRSLSTISKALDERYSGSLPDYISLKAVLAYSDGSFSKDASYNNLKEGLYSKDRYLNELLKNKTYKACAPYYIYRRAFIENYGLRFLDGIIHEDELWTPMVLEKVETILFMDFVFYNHFVRKGSIGQSGNHDKSGKNYLFVATKLFELLGKYKISEYEVIREQMVILFLQGACMVNDKPNVPLKKRLSLVKNSKSFKTRLKSLAFLFSNKVYYLLHRVFREG